MNDDDTLRNIIAGARDFAHLKAALNRRGYPAIPADSTCQGFLARPRRPTLHCDKALDHGGFHKTRAGQEFATDPYDPSKDRRSKLNGFNPNVENVDEASDFPEDDDFPEVVTAAMGVDGQTIRGVLSNLISLQRIETESTIMDTLRRLIDTATPERCGSRFDGSNGVTSACDRRRGHLGNHIGPYVKDGERGTWVWGAGITPPTPSTPTRPSTCGAESNGLSCERPDGHGAPHRFRF